MTDEIKAVALIVIAAIVIGFLIAALIGGGGTDLAEPAILKQTDEFSQVEYEIFPIEGMPCITIDKSWGRQGKLAMSCDWSKWKGELSPELIR